MVKMTDSSLLVERKATYSEILQHSSAIRDKLDTSHQYLNGDISYYGRIERSNSESSDSQLDNLLEAADRIRNGKTKGKKKVRFNMAKNEEFTYSYTQHDDSSDDEGSRQSKLSSNINLVGFDFTNGQDDDDNEDDDDDSADDYDDDDDNDDDDEEYDTETSEDFDHGLGKYGYLVDKSSEQINKDINGNVGTLQNGTENHVGKSPDDRNPEIATSKLYEDKRVGEKETQVLQLEKSLLQRKNSVQRHLSDLGETLRKTREDANREMEELKKDLEARRQNYQTEIENINRRREEEKRKFEEELEEFQNEKKLEERRQRYHEHEALITEKEAELEEKKRQAVEQDREIREYEEYLNRRHAVCNNKEEDLAELQNELETLSQELEAKRERLLNKSKKVEQEMQQLDLQQETAYVLPPLLERRARSASRVSTLSRGTDLRIEELKHQNKQLLEELFSLKKALEAENERAEETQQTMGVLESENKRLQQKVKNLETQLELARKSAELASETTGPSVDEIRRKTTVDMRNSRVLRPSRISTIGSVGGSHLRLSREPSKESLHSKGSKGSGSGDSGKDSKESGKKSLKNSSKSSEVTGSKEKGRTKTGSEKVSSALCVVM